MGWRDLRLRATHSSTVAFRNNLACAIAHIQPQMMHHEARSAQFKGRSPSPSKLLGEYHPEVAASLSHLASVYTAQGHHTQAETLLKQALAISKQVLGEVHPDVAQSFNSLAVLYFAQSRYGEAESCLVQSLAIAESQFGIEHPHTITIRKNLENVRSHRNPSTTT